MDCEDFNEALSKIKQTGSLRDYQKEFERLGNRVHSWTQKALVETFMGGLKIDIAYGIRMFKPKSLNEAISLARMKDEQLTRHRKFIRPFNQSNTKVPSPTKPKIALPMKRLSWDEMQRKRARGLCFNCDERFTPGHKCQGPKLLLLKRNSSDTDDDKGEGVTDLQDKDAPEISLYALTGWSTTRTMRVIAKVGPHELMVLIDSRSTHNFINDKVAGLLQLPVVPTKPFNVKIANGKPLTCHGRFENVQVLLQGIPFTLTLYSLPLTGLDLEPKQLPPTREIDHRINLKEGIRPIKVRPYRYAYFQKSKIEKQVHNMLKLGLIRPSTSPLSSPVLLVKKKDGTWRFCTNYRALNAVIIKDRFSFPTVDDILDELYGVSFFTKLDLRSGYHQVRVHPLDIHKIAFHTHNGHYEYLVMPFDLCNAPSTFQAIMNSIFRPFLQKFVLIFFDDILIYSPNWTMHLEHVKTVFEILRHHKFLIKFSKCAFGQQEIEYLGHIVTSHGVKVDQEKIKAMLNWPTPTNVSDLRGFLGLTGYYRKFVCNYGAIARPLTNLLKKGKFEWTKEADSAFNNLKQAMTSTSTLAMPNFNEPFVIESDASGEGIGAVLTQQNRLIAFMSRALGVTKQSWSTYAKEMLVIIQAIKTWRPYLIGRKFYIHTDQRSLKYFEKPGEPYIWRNGLVCYKNRVIIPPNSYIIPQLLQEFHDSPLGGHSGVLRTFKRLAQQFYWPSIHKVIREYVVSYDTCQINKTATQLPVGLLQPLPIPCQVWEDITIDFIEGLPPSNGQNTIMVVIDRLSKYAHFLTLSHPFTAKMVAEKFIEVVIKLHRMPRSIISDRDLVFISRFWREFFKMSGTQLNMSSAYHPQTDGQSKVVNRCVKQYLRCFASQQPRKWTSFLPWAEYWYNTAYHASTGMTLFQALYGRLPPNISHYEVGSSTVNEVDQALLSRDVILKQLKTNLHVVVNRMKQVADSKRRDVEYQVGDSVFLKLHPYRQQTVFKRAYQKLANRFCGPYLIEEKIEKVAYKLKLPDSSQVHPIFHVSFLKKYVGDNNISSTELPPIADDGEIIVELKAILDTRWVKKGKNIIEESLVQWKKLPIEDATWENIQEL
ncbi:hypothetical protein ACOSQ2_010082 [Xanthoceras sorbifolium]